MDKEKIGLGLLVLLLVFLGIIVVIYLKDKNEENPDHRILSEKIFKLIEYIIDYILYFLTGIFLFLFGLVLLFFNKKIKEGLLAILFAIIFISVIHGVVIQRIIIPEEYKKSRFLLLATIFFIITVGILALGGYVYYMKKKKHGKINKYILGGILLLFSSLSIISYLTIGDDISVDDRSEGDGEEGGDGVKDDSDYEFTFSGAWSSFIGFLFIISVVLFAMGKGKGLLIFSGSLLVSYVAWAFGISGIVSNIYDSDKKHILFTDYTTRIMDSSYTELEDMTNTQSNRFYARTTLLVILYFLAPVAVIFSKIKKLELSLSLFSFWLFVCFPLISTFFSHDCVLGEPDEDTDLYYTRDNILKMHIFKKVDDEVE